MVIRLLFVLVSLSMVPSEGFCALIESVSTPTPGNSGEDVVEAESPIGRSFNLPIGSAIYAGNNYGLGVVVTRPEVYEAIEEEKFTFQENNISTRLREMSEENQDPELPLRYVMKLSQKQTRYTSQGLDFLRQQAQIEMQDRPWIENGTHVFRNDDNENVMDKERISRTHESLKVLYDETQDQEGKESELFSNLQGFLGDLKDDSPVFLRVGAALLTVHPPLTGDLPDGDDEEPNYHSLYYNELYTVIKRDEDLYDVVWMANAAARVWHLVNTLKPENPTEENEQKFRQMLQQDFVKALASCIRPNALSRVCDLGKMQRMLCVLQGHVPGIMIDDVEAPVTSDQFLKGFMVKFEPLLPDILNKEPDEQRIFVNTMRTSLTTEFQEAKKDTEEFAAFRNDVEKQFNNFIRLSFDLEDDLEK